ncbi:MAG: hypothetical protein UR26_C0004G0037 [candidate division TM6 bacterium GW2011_GWF2_32_72]|nr:MAG: hypothetical protein UR26_C0004G0037 [candidate division TM6 bacterium GW2011_GWF2_32_72]
MLLFKYVFVFLTVFFSVSLQAKTLQDIEEKSFPSSFIGNYGIGPESKATREYHFFVLMQASKSLLELEQYLKSENFELSGRMIISGYQEEAVPSYYCCFNRKVVDDEVIEKTKEGFGSASKNIFGFLTGFMLKDCNWLWKNADKKSSQVFTHILPEKIDLFDDNFIIFQKHAFGSDFEFIIKSRDIIEKALIQQDTNSVLKKMMEFWEDIYLGQIKSFGDISIATQDILFSIYYMRYILNSNSNVKKFYVGPDITYPIEVLECQDEEITKNAQYFVKLFEKKLVPIEDKKTVYIFCSFVDGVGKSTLLGNLTNYVKYGSDISSYERVDNSSSQEGTLYNLKNNVYILDLPAQMSHFVTKPDGYVYVQLDVVTEHLSKKVQLEQFVALNYEKLKKEFLENVNKAKLNLTKSAEDKIDLDGGYLKNIVMLDLLPDEVDWIPFNFDGANYLFDKNKLDDIKVLVPLAGVHSFGLKVVKPEQMIFTGVSLPMYYPSFLNDISSKLKKEGIEKLVFVDFMSMYPRTQRENIRVNFMLQQLKALYQENFNLNKCFYRPFVNHNADLYNELRLDSEGLYVDSLVKETALRWGLFDLFKDYCGDTVRFISVNDLDKTLKPIFEKHLLESKNELFIQAQNKISQEFVELREKCVLDKKFESCLRFNFDLLIEFSDKLQELFEQNIENDLLNSLWKNLDGAFIKEKQEIISDVIGRTVFTEKDVECKVLYEFFSECRDAQALDHFINTLKANWYALLSNLLESKFSNDRYYLENVFCVTPPMLIKKNLNKKIVVVQKLFPIAEKPGEIKKLQLFNIIDTWFGPKRQWGVFDETKFCLDWFTSNVSCLVYNFGYNTYMENAKLVKVVDGYLKENIEEGKNNNFMPTAWLFEKLTQTDDLSEVLKDFGRMGKKEIKEIDIKHESFKSVQLFVRAIATLDMLVKDIKANIMSRRGNKEDFKAELKLLEQITLPIFFGIKIKGPLFEDYEQVEPLISWDKLTLD